MSFAPHHLRHVVPLVVALFACAATLTPPPALAAWPSDSTTNLRVCTGPGGEYEAALLAVASPTGDRKTGAYVAWTDYRAGASNTDVYMQRLYAAGEIATGWPASGLPVCALGGLQEEPVLVTDGGSGAIVVWCDTRPGDGDGFWNIYAQHVLANGAIDPAWPPGGAPVTRAAMEQSQAQAVADGNGGVIVVWADTRSGDIDVYANHLLANGVVDGSWPADGRVVCNATAAQYLPRAVGDGAGGAIVTWTDSRGSGDIYVQRMSGATGLPVWTPNGVPLCALASGQANPSIVADGSGGAVVVWEDLRNVGSTAADIYAHHVTSAGVADAGWPVDGLAVSRVSQTQGQPVAVADGTGGALVVFLDFRYSTSADLSAHHVRGSGSVDPAWPAGGLVFCSAASDQNQHEVVSDGAGGLLACWVDQRAGGDIYAQRLLSTGVTDSRWRMNGTPVCLAANGQMQPALVAVDDGDAIAVWSDWRSGTSARLFAQRITGAGVPGMTAPNLADVRDVAADQGGRVHVLWEPSALDSPALAGIADYRLWRRLVIGGGTYWEFLAQVPAKAAPGYAFMAPTTADSSASGASWNTFRVTAHPPGGLTMYASGIQSGYSVDNLAPTAPQALAGSFTAGTTTLTWSAAPDPDVAAYRVYRGDAADFEAGPAALVAEVPGTSYADAAGAPRWYRVAAVDAHGNEGASALLAPASVTGAGPPGAPPMLALSPPRPNPARGTAELELALPSGAHVSCAVYDMGGRLVRVLHDAPLPAGTHRLAWDTADGGGAPVAGGLYFIRLEVAGARFVRRLAVLR